MATPLSHAQLADALAALPGWSGDGQGLHRELTFPGFPQAIAWMAQVAPAIEQANHHPEWSNVYNRVRIVLRTHDAGDRVTAKDVALAKLLEASLHETANEGRADAALDELRARRERLIRSGVPVTESIVRQLRDEERY
jgi:4a-hydroxytetrahydrobiopterin dehydratase